MKHSFLLLCTLLCGFNGLYAQIGGSSAFAFMKMPFSARTEALGGRVYSVLDDDVSLYTQNPAMINPRMHHRTSFTYVNFFSGINMGSAAYARHFDKVGTFAGGIQYINYGNFTAADENGNITGKFNAADYMISAGLSRSFGKFFTVGLNTKFAVSQYESYSAIALGFDLGAAYVSKSKLFVTSIVLRNVGMPLKVFTQGVREPLPFEFSIGASHEFGKVPVRLSVVAHNLQQPDLSYINPQNNNQVDLSGQPVENKVSLSSKILRHFVIGAEVFPFKKLISVRVAYDFMRRYEMKADARGGTVGLSWGVGLRIHRFELNYSRSAYHLAGSPNVITLNVKLGPMPKVVKKPKEPKGDKKKETN
ncbi:MAG: type IX secretion system protein PorQ [Bacteroidia bacterium]|nr:type IX secretion system protein PorQ [Bacteroidia bacterium]